MDILSVYNLLHISVYLKSILIYPIGMIKVVNILL